MIMHVLITMINAELKRWRRSG